MDNESQALDPVPVVITSATPLTISKQQARSFHQHLKILIFEGKYDLFRYLEVIKFFDKVSEVIKGNTQSKDPEEREGDKEFKNFILTELSKYGKDGITTQRGAKFSIMENAGTKYHYENCGDPIMNDLLLQEEQLSFKIKQRQQFLQGVPSSGLEIRDNDELVTIYPPYKTSTTTYKVTLPK